MIAQEEKEKERRDAKNSLEEFVIKLRRKCRDEWRTSLNSNAFDDVMKKLDEAERWLYDEGEDASKEVYEAKMRKLEKIEKNAGMSDDVRQYRRRSIYVTESSFEDVGSVSPRLSGGCRLLKKS